MGQTSKTTVYIEDYQEVFFDLSDEVNKSGATRSALEEWIREHAEISASELQLATQVIANGERSLEAVVEECDTVEEFIEKANEATVSQ